MNASLCPEINKCSRESIIMAHSSKHTPLSAWPAEHLSIFHTLDNFHCHLLLLINVPNFPIFQLFTRYWYKAVNGCPHEGFDKHEDAWIEPSLNVHFVAHSGTQHITAAHYTGKGKYSTVETLYKRYHQHEGTVSASLWFLHSAKNLVWVNAANITLH